MVKICFSASSGGHYEQLMMLKPLMKKYDSFIITEKTNYEIKTDLKAYYVKQVNRKERSFIINFCSVFIKSLQIFIKEKPDYIISTGALATVPICIIGKVLGKKVIFIESFAKIKSTTITGKLIYKFADVFLIQWESLREFYPDAIYGGGIY